MQSRDQLQPESIHKEGREWTLVTRLFVSNRSGTEEMDTYACLRYHINTSRFVPWRSLTICTVFNFHTCTAFEP